MMLLLLPSAAYGVQDLLACATLSQDGTLMVEAYDPSVEGLLSDLLDRDFAQPIGPLRRWTYAPQGTPEAFAAAAMYLGTLGYRVVVQGVTVQVTVGASLVRSADGLPLLAVLLRFNLTNKHIEKVVELLDRQERAATGLHPCEEFWRAERQRWLTGVDTRGHRAGRTRPYAGRRYVMEVTQPRAAPSSSVHEYVAGFHPVPAAATSRPASGVMYENLAAMGTENPVRARRAMKTPPVAMGTKARTGTAAQTREALAYA